MALVTLVVVGHTWALLPATGLTGQLYDFLYLWHMPAFVLIAGHLSGSFAYDRRRLSALVRTVAVPYFVFEGLLALFRTTVGGEELEYLFLDPHWPMWFLVALFFWRLATPVLRAIPGSILPVAVAVLLSLMGGAWVSSETLDFSRIFGMLPFFVLGLVLTPEHLQALRGQAPRMLAAVTLAGIAVFSLATDRVPGTEWLYYRTAYDAMGAADDQGMLTRLALLLVGAAGALACLALLPRRDGWFARMGSASLVVYLFHGFFVKTAAYAGFGGWGTDHPALALVAGTVGGVAVALLLAVRPVASRLEAVVDPVGAVQRRRARVRKERERAASVSDRAEGEDALASTP